VHHLCWEQPSCNSTSILLDQANIGTVGTTNALGQTIAPQKWLKTIVGSGSSAAPGQIGIAFKQGVQGVMDKPGEFVAR
jgi:hypothetical protein